MVAMGFMSKPSYTSILAMGNDLIKAYMYPEKSNPSLGVLEKYLLGSSSKIQL